MHDQASELRRMARDRAARDASAPENRPDLIVLAGGKGGVGTTTIAVNLAAAMARHGRRTTLIDADPHHGDVALLTGLEERYTLADVLSGRRTIADVLQIGPGPIRVLPGVWGPGNLSDYPPAAASRLLDQLARLGTEADLVLVDAGNRPMEMTRPFWQAADLILVVTTADTASVFDTYALIKAVAEGNPPGPIHALVNRVPGAEVANNVHRRLAHACRRFLAVPLQDAGHVPADPQVAVAATAGEPFVIAAPGCGAARQVQRLAKALAHSIAAAKTRNPQIPGEHEPPKKSEKTQKTIQLPAVHGR